MLVYYAMSWQAHSRPWQLLELVKACASDGRGADVSAKDANGDKALHVAAGRGHGTIVGFLLKNAADIVSKTIYGGTPLQRVVELRKKAVVRILYEHCREHGIPICDQYLEASSTQLAAHTNHFHCDNCNNCDFTILKSKLYHCKICDGGDFGLWWKCFDKGISCYGDGRPLVKKFRDEKIDPAGAREGNFNEINLKHTMLSLSRYTIYSSSSHKDRPLLPMENSLNADVREKSTKALKKPVVMIMIAWIHVKLNVLPPKKAKIAAVSLHHKYEDFAPWFTKI